MRNPEVNQFPALLSVSFPLPLMILSGADGFLTPAIAKAINLTVFIFIFYMLIRKPVRQMFAERLASVRETLERAVAEKDAASKKMADLDARIDRLGDELNGIKARTVEEAESERLRIEAETEREIARIRQTAQREIDTARQVAISDLRNFAVNQAVDLAEQLIRREIKTDDDARLIQRVGEEMTRVN